MSHHSSTVDTLVLRTYDVGEADRFCVLFTREKGRLTARASGARRPGSRLGPALLPLSHLSLHLKSSSKGWIIAGVQERSGRAGVSVDAFMQCSEGVELLLKLTQDDEPLPEIFDATVELLYRSEEGDPGATLRYSMRLLHMLGFLPEPEEYKVFAALSLEDIAFIEASRVGRRVTAPSTLAGIRRLRDVLLRDHLSGPLKVPGVMAAMQD